MDSDFWTSRLAAAKRQFVLQNHLQSSNLAPDRFGINDFELEDEVRPDFSCPYCYEDFDIASLCSHLENEHSCESKVTVCPICSVKVRYMLGHITLHHGHLLKTQRCSRLRRVPIPNSQALSLLGWDLREAHLQVLLGGAGAGYHANSSMISSATAAAPPDPLLSSLILNLPSSSDQAAEEISKSVLITSANDDDSSSSSSSANKNVGPTHIWKSSFDPCLSHEERERRRRQDTGRAGFMQDLFLSTLLGD